MKTYHYLIVLAISLSFFSCNTSSNGRYVIYKVADSHKAFEQWPLADNDSIKAFLKHELIGKQLIIKFNGKYVSMGPPADPMKFILTQDFDRDSVLYYHEEIKKAGGTLTYRLKTDPTDGVILSVDMEHEPGASLIEPVQVGADLKASYEDRAICYLERLSEQ